MLNAANWFKKENTAEKVMKYKSEHTALAEVKVIHAVLAEIYYRPQKGDICCANKQLRAKEIQGKSA